MERAVVNRADLERAVADRADLEQADLEHAVADRDPGRVDVHPTDPGRPGIRPPRVPVAGPAKAARGRADAAEYDVVVAGAGPAGCSAALALAGQGRSVLLAHAPGGPAPVGEALPAIARVVLRRLGVAGLVPGGGHLDCHSRQSVWGSTRLDSVESIFDPHGSGWHLDRGLFDRRLRATARLRGAVERTAVIRGARWAGGAWELELPDPVRCGWLIDATGRRAAIATTHGARRIVDDRLIARHLTLGPSDAVTGRAVADRAVTDPAVLDPPVLDPAVTGARDGAATLVEAAPDGWWYTTPLPDRRRLLVFFTDADLPAAHATDLRDRLASTGPTAARAAAHPWPRHAAPTRAAAHSARLDTVHGEGWTAAGDAAAAFDPLSSQGIVTALRTGRSAGLAVHAHLAGDPHALHRYAAEVDALTTTFQRDRAAYYGLEQRWPDQPFWQRRG